MTRQMNLVGFYKLPTAHYTGQWTHPYSDRRLIGPELPQSVARTLEQGLFDMVFLADGIVTNATYGGGVEHTLEHGSASALEFDPAIVLACMSAVTSRLGLGCTVSTTFNAPFTIARQLGTLDVLAGGRVAWNIVTSHNDVQAQQFGADTIPPTNRRYDLADEVVEAVTSLWASWDPDAAVFDRERGLFVDPAKVRYVDYKGEFVKLRGPLSIPPSPQGRPLLMQAGASARGMEFAARWGELIFAMQHSADDLRSFRDELRERAAAAGRNPDEVKVCASVQPVIGETGTIARERQAFLHETVNLPAAAAVLSAHSGLDLSGYAMTTPIADIVADTGTRGSRGTVALLQQAAAGGMRTLEQAVRHFGISALTPEIVGTPRQVAEQLRDLFEYGAADGFMITPTDLPGSFEEFTRAVVPELQALGVYRTSYPGTTLRDIVGLPPVTAR